MAYIIAVIVVALDQYTKALASGKLASDSVPLIQDFFHFTYVENTGAAFGMFKDGNTIFIVLICVILAGIAAALMFAKPKGRLVRVSSGLIIGGALGNLIDRITRGFVIDFFDFRAINFPVFNIADSCVVIGAVLVCVYLLFFEGKGKSQNTEITEENAEYAAEEDVEDDLEEDAGNGQAEA